MGGGFTTTGAGTGGGGKNEQLELWVSQHHTPSLLGRKLHSSYLERHIPASGLVACAPRLALTPAWTARQMPPKMVNTMPRGTSQLAPMVVCGCQLRSADSSVALLLLGRTCGVAGAAAGVGDAIGCPSAHVIDHTGLYRATERVEPVCKCDLVQQMKVSPLPHHHLLKRAIVNHSLTCW